MGFQEVSENRQLTFCISWLDFLASILYSYVMVGMADVDLEGSRPVAAVPAALNDPPRSHHHRNARQTPVESDQPEVTALHHVSSTPATSGNVNMGTGPAGVGRPVRRTHSEPTIIEEVEEESKCICKTLVILSGEAERGIHSRTR